MDFGSQLSRGRRGDRELMSAATQPINRSARIQKAAPINLADTLQRHVEGIRNRDYFPLGLMMMMMLGVSDESAYFQNPVNKHLGPITKVQGLLLDWNQNVCPQ